MIALSPVSSTSPRAWRRSLSWRPQRWAPTLWPGPRIPAPFCVDFLVNSKAFCWEIKIESFYWGLWKCENDGRMALIRVPTPMEILSDQSCNVFQPVNSPLGSCQGVAADRRGQVLTSKGGMVSCPISKRFHISALIRSFRIFLGKIHDSIPPRFYADFLRVLRIGTQGDGNHNPWLNFYLTFHPFCTKHLVVILFREQSVFTFSSHPSHKRTSKFSPLVIILAFFPFLFLLTLATFLFIKPR